MIGVASRNLAKAGCNSPRGRLQPVAGILRRGRQGFRSHPVTAGPHRPLIRWLWLQSTRPPSNVSQTKSPCPGGRLAAKPLPAGTDFLRPTLRRPHRVGLETLLINASFFTRCLHSPLHTWICQLLYPLNRHNMSISKIPWVDLGSIG